MRKMHQIKKFRCRKTVFALDQPIDFLGAIKALVPLNDQFAIAGERWSQLHCGLLALKA